jgi:hypothetical protein
MGQVAAWVDESIARPLDNVHRSFIARRDYEATSSYISVFGWLFQQIG